MLSPNRNAVELEANVEGLPYRIEGTMETDSDVVQTDSMDESFMCPANCVARFLYQDSITCDTTQVNNSHGESEAHVPTTTLGRFSESPSTRSLSCTLDYLFLSSDTIVTHVCKLPSLTNRASVRSYRRRSSLRIFIKVMTLITGFERLTWPVFLLSIAEL